MRVPVRTSKWATAARRFAGIALPLVVVSIFFHRAAAMPTVAFELVAAVGTLLAALAVIAALVAFVRLWISGDKGWGRAVTGLVFGGLCLLPAGVLAADFLRYPLIDEVSTSPLDPPPLLSGVVVAPPAPAAAARLATLFPNLQPRNYPLAPAAVFGIVAAIVRDEGWQVLREDPPDDNGQGGQINVLATTLFGFREEVSIRLDPTSAGTAVAVRSVALTALHEAGANGMRVAGFLAELDTRIAAAQQRPATAEPVPAPLPAPPPARMGKR
jgi:hypothetical protein